VSRPASDHPPSIGPAGDPAGPDVVLLDLGPGARAALTGRDGGFSHGPYGMLNMGAGSGDSMQTVLRNRALVAAACGLAPDRLVWMRQVHGTTVTEVTGPVGPAGPPEAAGRSEPAGPPDPPRDAMFTSVPGLALGVLGADCPAVLLADPVARMVGAAHSGREGTADGVVPALVRAMVAAGAAAGRMHALIGPGICGGCYEVPAEMRDRVAAAALGTGCRTRAGTPGLDLRAGIAAQLAAAGVPHVRADGRCTAEDDGLYSYRRDGRTGRIAGLVWLTTP
jgi:polyphenol oxidase